MSASPVYAVRWFVPGTPRSFEAWATALGRCGLTVDGDTLAGEGLGCRPLLEWIENDGSFGDAFGYGTVTPDEQSAIAAAGSALVLDLPLYLAPSQPGLARLMRQLAQAGGLAARLEQSKLGWTLARWAEVLAGDDPWALYRCAVVVLTDGEAGVSRSCGMHAFGFPDAQVAGAPRAANSLIGALDVFQLAERPVLVSGDTFAPDADEPRRRLERWPDDGYPAGSPCHNPFGVWRLGDPGGRSDPRGAQRPVFVPPLVAILTAAEAKAGRPLRREEVERLTDAGTCVMMDHGDAQQLELQRGYADLEPSLAWAQWQVARAAGSAET